MAYEQIDSLERLRVEMPEKMLDEMQKIEDSEVKVWKFRKGDKNERKIAETSGFDPDWRHWTWKTNGRSDEEIHQWKSSENTVE